MNEHASLGEKFAQPVNDAIARVSKRVVRPPSVESVYVGATIALLVLYSAVFRSTLDTGWGDAFQTAIGNVFPLAMLAAGMYLVLHHAVLRRGVIAQALCHLVLAPAFALSWYALVLVALMLLRGLDTGDLKLEGFSGVALVWQCFQGVVLYALVAATTYALRGGRRGAEVRIVTGGALERYLTRQGDEFVPMAVADIVMVQGAQDYAEVTTSDGRAHLVRISLGDFEQRLPAGQFVRVHRSTIVNIAHLGRAEPIGSGRMALHLAGGQTVQASRTGVRALRELVL